MNPQQVQVRIAQPVVMQPSLAVTGQPVVHGQPVVPGQPAVPGHPVVPGQTVVTGHPVILPIQAQQQQKVAFKHHKVFFLLGMIEVSIATVCVVFGVVLVCLPYRYAYYIGGFISYLSSAIWCPIPLFVTGGLGICARKNPSRCLIIAGMVMAIITSIFMATMLIISISGAVTYGVSLGERAAVTFHSINSILSLSAFVIVIVHSVYCCRDTCNCCNGKQANVRYGYNASTQQVIQLPNGQGLVFVQGSNNSSVPTAGLQYNYAQPAGIPVTQLPVYSAQVMPSTPALSTTPAVVSQTGMKEQSSGYSGMPPAYQNGPAVTQP